MRRAEIAAHFAEIVEFAEVGPFIDTAVKHYSSGMYVRLAFAVAVHLRADILIADEVLAVGDVGFQNKCVAKMHDVVHDGRTVLFVSHNMAMVQKLCNRAILINAGRLVAEGPTSSVVGAYLDRIGRNAAFSLSDVPERSGKGSIRLTRIEIAGENGSSGAVATGRPTRLTLSIDRAMPGLSCSFDIYDQLGQPVTYFNSSEHGLKDSIQPSGKGAAFCCEIGELLLVPGRYRIDATVSLDGEVQDHVQGAAFIEVEQGLLDGRPILRSSNYGNVVMHHRWTVPA